MAEVGNQNQTGAEEGKTFTQEDVNKVVADRLSREKAKYADYDEIKSKLAKYEDAQNQGKSELQKLQEANQALLDKLSSSKLDDMPSVRLNVLISPILQHRAADYLMPFLHIVLHTPELPQIIL